MGGAVLNHLNQPCAAVLGFGHYEDLALIALQHVPGADAPVKRLPLWTYHRGMGADHTAPDEWLERWHAGPHCSSVFRLLPPRNYSSCAISPPLVRAQTAPLSALTTFAVGPP